ncbi:hypothetical protein ASPBRDRAFT_167566 [Aspergillus brasiliensis CBS 101740]|uniref:BZIP domain-containing protein n=1 Tax=Aspergillus brasiliensis (strain CBS 101740 / IMI 381727 / IBT 21946) TaxID=767769 RepID=A0A1L9V2P3_ASPBC|nr:hypothetical protein ASPBRDRAFT_167566 [Aspergillus brasiliensis CBS 101740]
MKTRDAPPQPATPHVIYVAERSPADDWHGITDAKERRKRQNRLNQRVRRYKARLEQAGSIASNGQFHPVRKPTQSHLSIESTGQLQSTQSFSGQTVGSEFPTVTRLSELHNGSKDSNETTRNSTTSPQAKVDTLCTKMPHSDKVNILRQRIAEFHSSYQLNCPQADHLLSLTRMNVHRAFVTNMATLGITWEWMKDDSISPFSLTRPGHDLPVLPESLRPTELQRSSPHHTWIDLFPCPIMRNNLIRVGNDWDDEELCTDIMGFWDGTSTGPFGLIIWGEPADPRSWEITEGFVKKWGWLIHGCVELMWSTNHWRAKRGERPLFSMTKVYRQLGQT